MRNDHIKDAQENIRNAYDAYDGRGGLWKFYYHVAYAVVSALLAIAQAIREHD